MRSFAKKATAILLALIFGFCLLPAFDRLPVALADTWGGSYTTNSGYSISGTTITITSANGFAYIADRMVSGNYLTYTLSLETDLNMNNIDFKGMTPYDNPFKGTFNGNNHTITNFKMNLSDNRVGMFRKVDGCTIKDITFSNVNINGTKTGTGVVVGLADGGLCTFSNVKVLNGTVTGNARTAGLVGELNGSNNHTFINCQNGANVTASGSDTGGIVGSRQVNDYVTYTNCINTGEIYGNYGGGIMGWNKGFGTFTDCSNSGYIHTLNGGEAGGIIGKVEDDKQIFTRCRNTGTIAASGHAGGILGYIENSSSTSEFYNCENTGAVSSTSNSAGGMLGRYGADLDRNLFRNCINRGAISASQRAGGMVGDNKGHAEYISCVNYANITATSSDAGGICGYVEDDEQWLTDCINYGTISAGSACAGGMIGYCGDSAAGTFTRCFNFGNVTSGNHGGGIIGSEDWGSPAGEVTYCMNWGDVNSNSNGGGIVGNGNWLNVRLSFNKGNIKKRDNNTGYSVGGIVGDDSNALENCFNTGTVRYGDYAAGMVGYKSYGDGIVNCYNAGSISNASNNYQIYGNSSTADTNNYYLSTASGTARSGETAKTAAQLQASNMPGQLSSSYVQDTWGVNSKYPIHKWWRDGYFYFTANFTDGGSTVSSVRKQYNNSITAPTRSKTGYVFDGWYTGSTRVAGSGGSITAGVTAPMNTTSLSRAANTATWEGSVTYQAQWTAKSCKVILNGNGATTAGTANVTATYDSAMPNATMPTKTGYTFLGYYDTSAATGGTQYYTATGASARTWNKDTTADTTLWARWTPNTDTVYNVRHYQMKTNGTDYELADTDTLTGTSDSTLTVANLKKTYTGFTYKEGKVGGSVVTATTVAPDGSRIIDLYYTRNTYTVTFKSGIDGSTLKTQTGVYYGTAATAPTVTQYVKIDGTNHYKFSAWDKAFSNVTANTTVTANYSQEGHDWTEWTYDVQPTCTDGGHQTRSCTSCGETAERYPSSSGHNFTGAYHNVSAGKHNRKCLNCSAYGLNGVEGATENCSGGTANCVDLAVCQHCGATYGTTNANNHKSPENRAAVAATCTTGGYTAGVYCTACTNWVSGHTATQALTHVWSNPSYTWGANNATCTAERHCTRDGCTAVETEEATVTSEETLAPKCGVAGETTYTATFTGEAFEDQTATAPITALEHIWSTPSYTWGANNATCAAERHCTRDNCTAEETENGTVNSEETLAPKCGVAGETTYTATFTNNAFETQTATSPITALTHVWSAPSYTWGANNATCAAERHCTRDGCTAAETEEATVTSEETLAPKCGVAGETTYTATFTNGAFETQTTTSPIAALAHIWSEPTYTWGANNATCAAERHCTRTGCTAVETENGTVNSEETLAPKCGVEGETTYTATFTNNAFETQTTTSPIAALTHVWSEPTYTWGANNATCAAERHCTRTGCTVVETENGTVNSEETLAPKCGVEGETTYTATFTNNAFETQTTTSPIAALAHVWSEPTYTWGANNATCAAERHCTRENCTAEETEDGTVNSEETLAPKCGVAGETTYTATFTGEAFENQTATSPIAALEHIWSTPSYTWGANNATCAAERHCTRDGCTAAETEEATVTSEETLAPKCGVAGETTYTATFTGEAFEDQTATAPITALEHNWSVAFTWTAKAEGGYTVSAVRTCSLGDHPE
ncbi:MAG: InlB B-repeat-containing protein, partial [Clostridia bacterium]|nr:InlB B-repeat-containing protein [Clostridia bacterium]